MHSIGILHKLVVPPIAFHGIRVKNLECYLLLPDKNFKKKGIREKRLLVSFIKTRFNIENGMNYTFFKRDKEIKCY